MPTVTHETDVAQEILDNVAEEDAAREFRTVCATHGEQVTKRPVRTLERATEHFNKGARIVLCEKLKTRKAGGKDSLVQRMAVSLVDAQNFYTGTTDQARMRRNSEQRELARRYKNLSMAGADKIPKSDR